MSSPYSIPVDNTPPAAAQPAPRKRRSTIAFALVAAMLICAAIGLNATVAKMQVSFRKLPVDTRLSLSSIKSELGPWAQVTIDRAQGADLEHELGTKAYLFRDYLDTRLLKPEDRDALLAASIEDREKTYLRTRADYPKASIKFALTYYTGGTDTVPHVPDRCFAADGFKPSTYSVVTWPILPGEGEARNTQVRLINFIDQIDSRQSRPRQVSYFFQVNGQYEQDPIFGVRKRLQSLLERRGYFAKIELVTDLADASEGSVVMTDFLQHAMSDIERVLPDPTQFIKQ